MLNKPMKLIFSILFFFLITTVALSQTNKLDYYLDQAMQNSPLLKDYQNQQDLNRLDSLRILATYKPQVTGNSFNFYAPVAKGIGYDQIITNGGNFSALVGVNKTIVNKKNIGAQFENLHLQNQSVANTAKISEQDLKKAITAQYITTYGDIQQLNFNKEVQTLLAKEETILKKLTEKNVYKQVDYLSFLVTQQQLELLIKQLAIQFQNDYAMLNYLCGIINTTTVILEPPEIRLYQQPGITNSVFFKQFEIDSLKLSNSRTLIDVSYKPKFNLFADAGYLSSLALNPYKNFGTSFGISAQVPIYDGKQKKLQYSKIAIAEKNRLNYKSFFGSQYNQQISQLTQQLNSTDELIRDINNQLKYSQSLIEVNEKLLEAGEVKIADYILALGNYLNAKNLITQNMVNRLQIINQINYWNR